MNGFNCIEGQKLKLVKNILGSSKSRLPPLNRPRKIHWSTFHWSTNGKMPKIGASENEAKQAKLTKIGQHLFKITGLSEA